MKLIGPYFANVIIIKQHPSMRKSLLLIAAASGLLCPALAKADGLVPEQTSLDSRKHVFAPIYGVSVSFDGGVAIAENAVANIYHGSDIVATAALAVDNYVGQTRTQGWVTADFAEPLVLPKGEEYRFEIEGNLIASETDPTLTNDAISVSFSVPSTLGPCDSDIDQGEVVATEDAMVFYWGTETASTEAGALATLYREGEAVRQFPFSVSWDWDLGQARVDFGQKLNFENGVSYTLEIPAGSVCARERPDIVNEAAEITFIGGYTEPLPTIDYVWCSLFTDHPTDYLGVVKFHYAQPVMLSSDPRVELWNVSDNALAKTAVPTLAEADGTWVLTADFEQTPLEPEKGYTIVVVEGTLISASGDVVVNARKPTDIPATSGIADIDVQQKSDAALYSVDGALIKRNATLDDLKGLPHGIYVLNGRKIAR